MGKKHAVLYSRMTLDTPKLIEATLRWARRKYRVERIVVETNERQPRLRQILRIKGVTVIAPDAYHLASPDKILHILTQSSSVALMRERLILNRHHPKTATVFKLAQATVAAQASARSHNGRLALLASKLIGKRIGRPPLTDELCDRAIALLKQGKSLRTTAQEVGISKSAAQRLARTLKK